MSSEHLLAYLSILGAAHPVLPNASNLLGCQLAVCVPSASARVAVSHAAPVIQNVHQR